MSETNELLDQVKSTARDFISEVKEKKTKLQKIQEYLHRIELHTSKLPSFLGLHQIEQKVHQFQLYVENMGNDDRAKDCCIKMKQNHEIEKILSKLGSLESLGKVISVKQKLDLIRETSVRRKAPVESREQSNINNMTMNIETKNKISIKKDISDMICLMDGRIIAVELNAEVNITTSQGIPQKQLPISGEAYSVTQINQNTIAITYPAERAIKIYNIEHETVTKVITLHEVCRGLSFSNKSLAVGLNDLFYDEIRIIDLEGNTLKSIQVESYSYLENIVYCNDRVVYRDIDGNAVYYVDGSGKQIWRYKQDLEGPRGLCTDSYGNIIVADCDSDRIIVISKDGQDSKVLIGKEDGLKNPMCIFF